jgi:putative DNA primase/helicase
MACCPAHDDREPSLSIIDGNGGKVLVRCHAGCDQPDVIGALRSRGVWATEGRHEDRSPALQRQPPSRRARSRHLETYRGGPRPLASIATRRGNAGRNLPAVARATFLAAVSPPLSCRIKASFGRHLARGGAGDARHRRRAAGDPPHLPCPRRHQQGADRTSEDDAWPLSWGRGAAWSDHGSAVGRRGHRNALSAMQATGQAAWAALSTSGLRTLELPVEARDVVVLADGDEPGETAAHDRRGAGNEESGAFASAAHREGLISTTCCWAAPSSRGGSDMTSGTEAFQFASPSTRYSEAPSRR